MTIIEQAIAPPNLTSAHTGPEPKGSAEAVLRLVEQWLAEEDNYDQEVWPIVQRDIEENRLSDRSRFHG